MSGARLTAAAPARPELLAPAGSLEAGYAAFQNGADAVYFGLRRFSARAEAANFTLEEAGELVAWAHARRPPGRLYAAVNTLVRDDELGEALEALAALAELGVDAAIIQDLGLLGLARRHLPGLRLHASTQLAVHDLAGARQAAAWGCRRVTLARELSLAEVREIAAAAGVEVEVFVHGALCFSYSGLCLYSSLLRARSGNRGRCAYPCREAFRARQNPAGGQAPFPFALRDLAWADLLPELVRAGVAALKIEGRKKSPLYVAAATAFYRRLLDEGAAGAGARQARSDLQSVFSRPWTELFARDPANREVADSRIGGHRGAPLGRVEGLRREAGRSWVRFTLGLPLGRHDGVQAELPDRARPWGFAVERLRRTAGERALRQGAARHPAGEASHLPAGARVEVLLPAGHPPLPAGTPLFLASASAVRARYRWTRPPASRRPAARRADFALRFSSGGIAARAALVAPAAGLPAVAVENELAAPLGPARDPEGARAAVVGAFSRLGGSGFAAREVTLENPQGLFAPLSQLNGLRRRLAADLEQAALRARAELARAALAELSGRRAAAVSPGAPRWSLMTDRPELLAGFAAEDFAGLAEVVVVLGASGAAAEGLAELERRLGRDRVRLALPAVARRAAARALAARAEKLRAAGWAKWQIANISGFALLAAGSRLPPADLLADWPLYAVNRAAAAALLARGCRGFTVSPEDGGDNLRALLGAAGERATVVVHGEAPLFLSAACARAARRGCPGQPPSGGCPPEELLSAAGEEVLALQPDCGTVLLPGRSWSSVSRLAEFARWGAGAFRADFLWRPYTPAEVRAAWRELRAGRVPAGAREAPERNLD